VKTNGLVGPVPYHPCGRYHYRIPIGSNALEGIRIIHH